MRASQAFNAGSIPVACSNKQSKGCRVSPTYRLLPNSAFIKKIDKHKYSPYTKDVSKVLSLLLIFKFTIMFLLTCYAIITGVTAGGVGVLWANVDSDEKKESSTSGSYEPYELSSNEYSVLI